MKYNNRKIFVALLAFVLFLSCIGTAFAAAQTSVGNTQKNGEHGNGLFIILFLLDLVIISRWIHKVYHSMFKVYYFSFDALLKELIVIAFIAGFILIGVPIWLSSKGFSDTVIGIYFAAAFILPLVMTIRKAKKSITSGQKEEK